METPLPRSPLGCDTHWGKPVKLNSGDNRLALCCIRPAQGTHRPSMELPKLCTGGPPEGSRRRQAVADCPSFLHTHLLPSPRLLLEAQEPGNQALVLGEGKEQPSDPSWGCGLWRLQPQSVGWDYTLPPYSSDECSGVGVTL